MLFDRHRLVVQSLGDELAATPPEVIQQIVECVETADREIVGWLPTGPAEPFASALLSPWRPRTAVGASVPPPADELAWYAGVAG